MHEELQQGQGERHACLRRPLRVSGAPNGGHIPLPAAAAIAHEEGLCVSGSDSQAWQGWDVNRGLTCAGVMDESDPSAQEHHFILVYTAGISCFINSSSSAQP